MTDPVVEVADLRFAWSRSAAQVIEIESLRILSGERVFLRGASGSGKSTLLSLLAGVVTPQAGTVRVLGQDLGALCRRRARPLARRSHWLHLSDVQPDSVPDRGGECLPALRVFRAAQVARNA